MTVSAFTRVVCLVGAISVAFVAERYMAGAGTLWAAHADTAQASDNVDRRLCSSRTLRGRYGLKLEGHSPVGPFASIAQIVFDGDGQIAGFEIGSINGRIVERAVAGRYTVDPDCRGFIVIPSEIVPGQPHEARGDLVLVDGGKELFIVDNEERWVVNGVGKKF